jgi:SAM-dependent methyltransferase
MDLAVRHVMSTDYPSVLAHQSGVEVAKRIGRVAWTVPVIAEGGKFQGLVTSTQIIQEVAAESDLKTTTAGQLARPHESIGPDEPFEQVIQRFTELAAEILPVTDQGRLIGVITRPDVDAFRRLEEQLGPRVTKLDTRISPDDGMNAGLRGHYLFAGASALRCIQTSLESAGRGDPASVLDLPCGYGRVLRVLMAAYPDARFVSCDIDRDAVDFCGNVLGATPVYSASDPAEIPIEDRFDLIWVGSLFTHFPAHRWPGFLDFFADHLTTDGLLIFTTLRKFGSPRWIGLNKEKGKELREQYARNGYGYIPQRGKDLGISIAAPAWIKTQIEAHPRLQLYRFDEEAWEPVAPRHDVTTCLLGSDGAA